MAHPLFHSLILIVTVGVSYLLWKTIPPQFDLQLTGLIFVMYVILKRIFPGSDRNLSRYQLIDAVAFTLIILNIVHSTGGFSSPLFFLLFFLIFALSLMLEPIVSMTTTLAITSMYALEITPQQGINELIPLLSLPFLTPFALFLGKEYQKNIRQKEQIKSLEEKTTKVEDESAMFISLVVKNHLKMIKDLADNFMGDHELDAIKRSVRRTERLIDEFQNKKNG